MFMPKFDFEHCDITIYFYFRSYFYYHSTFSLFFIIFPAESFFYFTLLYTPISLCLSGNVFYFSIYISLVSVATIYFLVLFYFDGPYCGCNLFLPHLILVFYCVPLFVTVTLFADDTQVIFIYMSVTYDSMFFLYSTSFYA